MVQEKERNEGHIAIFMQAGRDHPFHDVGHMYFSCRRSGSRKERIEYTAVLFFGK
jgi:hypothetical protein